MEKSRDLRMSRQNLKVWWASGTPNFGDILTPYVLDHFNIGWEFTEKFDTICIGSIAKHATTNTLVLGSGIIGRTQNLCPTADWKFVRGPITRKRIIECGGNCPEIYGDPALLLPLFCEESKKEYDVGIVPHYVDYNLAVELFPSHNIINLKNRNPLEVAREISKCRTIISSSLHGIIAANAYGIPAAWVKFSDKLKGDGVKFLDYFQSINCNAELSTVNDPKFFIGSLDTTPIINIFQSLK